MTIQPLTGILIACVLVITLCIMCVWHFLTHGAWKHYAVGRALMGVFGAQSLILTLATASSLWPNFPYRGWAYVVVYVLLIGAMTRIGWTIWQTHKHHLNE